MLNIDKVGLGERTVSIEVYIANRPPLPLYTDLDSMHVLQKGEVADIAEKTGNHWRKIFNVYAKFLYELKAEHRQRYASWQAFRDDALLALDCQHNLLFSQLSRVSTANFNANNKLIRILMGKQHGLKLTQQAKISVNWLDDEFAIALEEHVIICPYFDYRQLSNQKISKLCYLIETHFGVF